MKKTMCKLLALAMSLMMVLGSLPIYVIAEGLGNLLPEGNALSIQESSDAFSFAEHYDIAPIADIEQITITPQTSRYSATAFADASATTVFVGDTTFIRYRVKSGKEQTGRVKIKVEQYVDGSLVNETYKVDRVGSSGSDWDAETSTFMINDGNSSADIYLVGFKATEDLVNKKVTFKLSVYNEAGDNLFKDDDQLQFQVDPADEKYDFDIQLYRAIQGEDGTFSFNSTEKVDFISGSTIKFKLAVQNLCDKDITLKLEQSDGPVFTYSIDEDESDTTQPGFSDTQYNDGTLILPAGVTVVLKTDRDYDNVSANFKYTVKASLQNTKYSFSSSKTITGTVQEDGLTKKPFGYNLAIASASFPGAGEFKGDKETLHTVAGTRLVENGYSAGNAQKYVHEDLYAEGDKITVVNVEPVDSPTDGSAKSAFLFWYDKRALTEKGRFLRPGDTVYKDNTDPHSIDAIWAYLPAFGTVEIHDGDSYSVTTEGVQLVGENNEYSTESVLNMLDTTYSYEMVKYVDGKQETYRSDSFASIEELMLDANWQQKDIGHYEYTITASIKMSGGSTEIATTSATAEVSILPRPVVVVANSRKVPFDGNAHDVKDQNAQDPVPANSPYTVWTDFSDYASDGELDSGIYSILNAVYEKATGDEIPDDVKYTEDDVYLAEGSWTEKHDLVSVVYGTTASDRSASKTDPGKYTAYIDMDLGTEPYLSGTGYTVYVVGNYAYILLDGELEIIPAYLQFNKELKDDGATSATFTFKVTGPDGDVKFKSQDGMYIQAESGISEFTLTYPGSLTSPKLMVYTDEGTGLQYTVTELNSAMRNGATIAVDEAYDSTTYTWSCTDGENPAKTGTGSTCAIPMNETATVSVTNQMEPAIRVTKALAGTAPVPGYQEDETITWTVTVENIGNMKLYEVVLTDALQQVKIENVSSTNPDHSIAGPYSNPLTIGTLALDEVVTVTVSYVVTAADVQNGSVTNTARADGHDSQNVTVNGQDEDTEPTFDPLPGLEVTKTNADTSGKKDYKDGDTITYTITVENTGNVPLTNVVVTDELASVKFTAAVSDAVPAKTITASQTNTQTLETLDVGETVTITAQYAVTQDDVNAGKVHNKVTATGQDPKKETVEDEDVEDVEITQTPKLSLVKETTSRPAQGGAYHFGETITYKITVTNDGNVPLENVEVVDELTGDTWTIPTLAPGASRSFTAEHVVTEEDILAGQVVNVATATGENPNHDPQNPDDPKNPKTVPGGQSQVEDPTAKARPHLSLVKETTSTPRKDGAYTLGETITYKITVTNDGNVTLNNVVIVDELTGDTWTIPTLAPDESKSFTAEHVVTEADILAGQVVNVATATGENTAYDPNNPDDPENPKTVPGGPSQVEDPTAKARPHLSLIKETTSTPKNGGTYSAGETITYKITATNDGNVTLKNVAVVDELTGDKWIIPTLAPGESKSFAAEHVVTEADTVAGRVVNVATAIAENPNYDPSNPNDPDNPQTVPGGPSQVEDPTGKAKPHLTLVKETTSKPAQGSVYSAGETITYRITVTNDGNLTLKDVKVVDKLTGDTWTIPTLAPGESKSFTAKYVVTEADVEAGRVVNVATATAENPNYDPNNPDDSDNPKTVPSNPGRREDPTQLNDTALPSATPNPGPDSTPKTGDDSNLTLWVAMLAISFVGMVATAAYCRRKRALTAAEDKRAR